MKKAYIIGVGLAAMSLTGCTDSFLNVDSPTQTPSDEYFSEKDHIEEAVVAAYDPLQWTDWACNEYAPYTLMSFPKNG